MSYNSLADFVAAFENPQGDPTALNYRYDATHTASGLYQITDSTWNNFMGYTSAYLAPADVQTQKFTQLVQAGGLSDWTCPGCNPKLTSYLANNPDVASLPITSQDGSNTQAQPQSWWQSILNMGNSAYGVANPIGALGSSVGQSIGTGQGIGQTVTNAATAAAMAPVNAFTSWLGSNAGRFLYGIIGLILIIMALLIYAFRTQDQG